MIVLVPVVLVLMFGLVVFFGAPYVPTFKKQTEIALDMLDLRPGQTLLELGCGDGKVLREAASRGVRVIGYELNPILVIVCKIRTWQYRKLVTVRWANFWYVKLPKCDGIYVFLLDKYMKKLDKKIIQESTQPVKLVSFTFQIPGKQSTLDKQGLYLYEYN